LIAGLVLAAGGSRRFGSPKQVAELDGLPLLQHAVDAMLAVDAIDPVVVVLGAAADEVRAAVRFGAARPVVCAAWGEGMAASLRCGVEAVGDCEWVVLTLGDQPRITPGVIDAVARRVRSVAPGAVAVRATYDGVPGHPVGLSRALLARVDELKGDVGARDLLASVAVEEVEVGELSAPCDVDTPADLEALRA
jgi:molybdenum cofactor cytidylyltransferase